MCPSPEERYVGRNFVGKLFSLDGSQPVRAFSPTRCGKDLFPTCDWCNATTASNREWPFTRPSHADATWSQRFPHRITSANIQCTVWKVLEVVSLPPSESAACFVPGSWESLTKHRTRSDLDSSQNFSSTLLHNGVVSHCSFPDQHVST